ncbi:hypothetical protein PV05_08180 [Exophiala xenobiotica]|uniref:Xylanolytic transcriptional activator regulatory domain-containing protein n=1 Tax=Exophiala xenobiotica TaxID=348802 RepID=A0A0D2ED25_9EURO|nr:uncharacterized protein PV05_08180 [Exophiala xenobiotica]KIW52550.1 hypothetical protein PV05_08180 [Exophiala xenobiotica]
MSVPTADGSGYERNSKLRLTLLSLLPSQHDADLIATSTNAWGLRHVLDAASHRLFESEKDQAALDLASVSEGTPVDIARSLLYLAVCLQQLPPEFDCSKLQITGTIDDALRKYLTTVGDLVTCKDDLACSTEGLECLLLQALFYINNSNLRRAWLAGRRAVNIAQFLGFHRRYLSFVRGRNKAEEKEAEKQKALMWMKVIMVDRYLALLLGLPCSVGDDCFGEWRDVQEPIEDIGDVLGRRLCLLAGLITTRNQKELPQSYTSTLEIDEQLEQLAKESPESWFSIPPLSPGVRSTENADAIDLVANQMCCLTASKEILLRYLAIRTTDNTQLHARVVDFTTVVASVILILNLVGCARNGELPHAERTQKDSDLRLVSQVLESMRLVARGRRELMARQGVQVMEALLAIDTTSISVENPIRLTVPFIGSVTVFRNRPSEVALQKPSNHGNDFDVPDHANPTPPGFAEHFYTLHELYFEQTTTSEPSWFPPLEAWDFDSFNDTSGRDSWSLWDVTG